MKTKQVAPTSGQKLTESVQWKTKFNDTLEILCTDFATANPNARSWAKAKTFVQWKPEQIAAFRSWIFADNERAATMLAGMMFMSKSEQCSQEAKAIQSDAKKKSLFASIGKTVGGSK